MRIAIVKLSALGDIVHAMVVLQFVKKLNTEISIDWIVDAEYKELLDCNLDINKIYPVDLKKAKKKKSLFKVFKELNKLRKLNPYDLVIDLQGLIKSAIISKLIPSSYTIGFDKFSSRESLASIFYNKTFNFPYESNVIERNIKIIDFALGLSTNKKEILNKVPFLYSSGKLLNTNLSNNKKNIILIPGASFNAKCYPASKLAKLSTLIDANFLVIWGDLEEKKKSLQIKKISPKVIICEKISINLLVSLVSQVDLVIGPDTGPTHLAWALNIPSITLFGPTPGKRNTYETLINKIIESDSKINSKKINKQDYSINEIQVKKIVEIANKLLYFN
jgi:heptosyltransferase-1